MRVAWGLLAVCLLTIINWGCSEQAPEACSAGQGGFALDGAATAEFRDAFGMPVASGGTTSYVGSGGARTWRYSPGESVGIPKPEPGQIYRVGVFAYFAGKSKPDVVPTVAVWLDDALAWQGSGSALKWRDMWEVGAVHWPAAGGSETFVPAKGDLGGASSVTGWNYSYSSQIPGPVQETEIDCCNITALDVLCT